MGLLLWRPGKRGDEEMIEYLISSYSDVININIQDKVNIEYCTTIMKVCIDWVVIMVCLIVWMDCLELCNIL